MRAYFVLPFTRKWVGGGLIWACFILGGMLLTACGDSPTATTAASATTVANTTTSAATIAARAVTTATSATTAAAPSATASAATGAGATGEVIVFAAASLTDAFNEIKTELEKANPGLKITYNYGGSNALRTQLEQGAKADVFASADQTQMDNAQKSGLVSDKGVVFVRNRLVVILPKGNPGKIEKLQDLARPGLKFVTAQKDVPVGTYTLQALDKLSKDPAYGPDFSTKVQANFVSQEPNVKQVVSKVQLGEADAGIVYISDVTPNVTAQITTLDIPDQFNTIATYPISALKGAANQAGAKVFQDYILSAPGQAILKKNNFIPINATGSASPTAGAATKATP